MIFFLGKGGVGKTTLSSAAAWHMNAGGKKVLIVSLDPAHNLGDVFHRTLSNEKQTLKDGIDAIEIDLGAWVTKYLDASRDEIRTTYNYQMSLNLDSFINILKYSPGTEEYAVLWAIEHIYETHADEYDIIIFDTPPTALTLRFLAMPSISRLWVKELASMREKILKKRQTILKINPEATVIRGAKEKKDDKVYGKLTKIRHKLDRLHEIFSKESYLTVIVNPDDLSLAEALRIKHELEKLDVHIDSICLNKTSDEGGCEERVKHSFQRFPVFNSSLLAGGLKEPGDLGKVYVEELVKHIFTEKTA